MPRRRLRIVSSSDEDDDDDENDNDNDYDNDNDDIVSPDADREVIITDCGADNDNSIEVDLESVTLNSSNTLQNHHISRQPRASIPLDISSDDDNVPQNPNIPNPNPDDSNRFEQVPVSDGSVNGILRGLGLSLRREWLNSCLRGLENVVPGFSSLDNSRKAKLCFQRFLHADMNDCGAGVLPDNLHSLHLLDLKGPFVLQVDEIVNISSPLKGRYQKAAPGIKRCLKLSMTDGVQHVFGMEYRPINALDVFTPAGLKVAICNVNVRRGLLMLVPEAFEVLGGEVEDLEAARQRLVSEVNKPPRGKRTRTGVVPSLATRATLAVWPQENINDPVHINNSRTESTVHLRTDEQGNACSTPAHDRAREDIAPLGGNDGTKTTSLGTASNIPANDRTSEVIAPDSHNDGSETNTSSVVPMDVEEVDIVNGLELPHILSGDREILFTYMASLLAKWAAMKDKVPFVQGKIKCLLTGVKGFRYKERATYELCVFVDDGSLISEVFIDHNLVHQSVGYSPQEVTAALASSDSKRVSEIKEKLKQFQLFLANFEGMMHIKMNNAFPFPVATEMNQGSSASDALLLLERLKSTNSGREQHYLPLDPINLSP